MSRAEAYLNIRQISRLEKREVRLKDLGDVWCGDAGLTARLRELAVFSVPEDRDFRYVGNVLDLVEQIQGEAPEVHVTNLGQTEYIIDYRRPRGRHPALEWAKTGFVCLVSFFGAAFAIMTFNNDVDVTKVFGEIHYVVTGEASDGFTILELSYSLGLAAGIAIFFNHFSRWKLNTDPTPLEVEMSLYEDNINRTVISNHGREESGGDAT